jgi:DNA-binding NarL/FixJ family response regulator
MPIIVLSSEAADTMIDKAIKLGADTYLMKPATLEELEKAMKVAFSKHMISE